MAPQPERSQSLAARRARKLVYGMNVLTAVILSVILWYMVNFLTSRHYQRWDVSATGYYTLSERTMKVLEALNEPLQVVAFVAPEHVLYPDVRHLLNEYDAKSRDVTLQWIDPERDIEKAEALLARHRIARKQSVLFISGTSMRSVSLDRLVERDRAPEGSYQPARRVRFSGEQWFTSAIHALSKKDRGTVYFLEGHGEKDSTRTDSVGYSKFSRLLEREYLNIKRFSFGDQLEIPEDCNLLIIPGPTRKISQPELDRIAAYLDNSGRAFVLLDALVNSGLEDLLATWNVEVGKDLLIDRSRSFSGNEIYVRHYGEHPITEPLKGIHTAFYNPRSIQPMDAGIVPQSGEGAQDRPQVLPLASCTTNGWAEMDTDVTPARFDEGRDMKGPLSMVVAVEKGANLDVEISVSPTRMVVSGDSDFLSNGLLTGAAEEFALHSVNWLLGQEELLAIPPKTVDEVRMGLDKQGMDQLFLWTSVLMPLIAAGLGVLIHIRRRN